MRNLVVLFLAALLSLVCYERAARNRYVSTLTEALRLIDDSYVEEVDTRVLFEGAMSGMFTKLDAPYSAFVPPSEYQTFKESLDQTFGGIGIFVEIHPVSKRLMVMSPLPDTPAYRAGLNTGDLIMKIGEIDTENMTIRDSIEHMRGPIGSKVKLTILRAGTKQEAVFTLTRAKIKRDSVFGDTQSKEGVWDFHLSEDRRIGLIRVETFGELTAGELRKALTTYRDAGQEVEGLIIDLRGNGGGLLTAAVEMCDMFLDEGVIVSTRGRNGVVRDEHHAEPGVEFRREIPLVILVDRYSASASEIFAACLQDHGRAVVCGQRSWGKGTVQNLMLLEGGKSAMRITTATYWRPSGKNIHKLRDVKESDAWGVMPDTGLDVSLTDDEMQLVVKQRRDKDFGAMRKEANLTPEAAPKTTPDQPPQPKVVEDPSSQGEMPTEDLEPFDDPQLRRAIGYLQEKIGPPKKAATVE
jgi:carboxyl-terminal processing protease